MNQPYAVYLAGPMTGLPNFNYDAFLKSAIAWRRAGFRVLNPAENYGGDQKRTYPEYIGAALNLLLMAEAIALLPGWERSTGARLELHIAQLRKYPVYDALTRELIRPFGTRIAFEDVQIVKEKESILEEAQRLVHGPRQADYSHPYDDYSRTGRIWGAILGVPDIDPRLCCLMMAAVKISRETHKHKRDSVVDLAGYAECAQLVAEKQGIA